MIKIDVKDKKILYQLDLNSRQSLKLIGSNVRLTKSVVQYRIDRLVREGVIKNFYTSIDFYKLGYINLGIYINYQYYTPDIEQDIIQHFVRSEHAWFIANVQGKYDLIILFAIKDMNQFFLFWKKTLRKYRFYFQDAVISFFTKTHYFPNSFLIDGLDTDKRYRYVFTDGGAKIDIDEMDREILRNISLNPRKPLIDIARDAGVSSTMIANRIKKLEKSKIINGYRININYEKLHLQLFNVEFNLRNYDKIQSIIRYAMHNPHLISASEVIDKFDLSLNYYIQSFNELHFIIKDIYNTFPDDVKNHMTLNYPQIYKYDYMPSLNL